MDAWTLQLNGMLLAMGDPGPMPDFLKVENRGKPMVVREKPFVWSYSALNCYADVCPHQFYRRYIARDIPFHESPQVKWGNEVHTAMEYRISGRKPLPVEMQAFEPFAAPFDGRNPKVEIKLGMTADGRPCDFFSEHVWGRGKVDVVVMNDTTAYIADHKSGGSKYEKAFELEVQALLLKVAYPKLQKIHGQYLWLAENRSGTFYDLSDVEAHHKKVRDIVYKIEQDKLADSFEKRKGPLCAYCSVGNCEYNKNPELG